MARTSNKLRSGTKVGFFCLAWKLKIYIFKLNPTSLFRLLKRRHSAIRFLSWVSIFFLGDVYRRQTVWSWTRRNGSKGSKPRRNSCKISFYRLVNTLRSQLNNCKIHSITVQSLKRYDMHQSVFQ
jgi:hypothetical protein